MKINQTLNKVKELYANNLKEKGISSQAVGWNSIECHKLRFKKLSEIIEDYNTPCSINDYGCGYGAHLVYLKKDLGINVIDYNGYDLSEKMLSAAKENLVDLNTKLNFFQSKDITTIADYSFISGTFNVKYDATKNEWEKFISNKLIEINKNTDKAFSFNLLTSYVDYEEPHLYYGDPLFWFDFCKKNFSKNVSLLHDYDLWEWTMLIKK